MQNWPDLYIELAEKISANMPDIRWVDLWHNQVNFLESEHPFPTPAIFLSFRVREINDVGLKVQNVILQMDAYLYYETFLDTFQGAYNQAGALEFLKAKDQLHALFHRTDGENYSSMRRVDFHPVDTGSAGNLYRVVFECALQDYSAAKSYQDGKFADVSINRGNIPPRQENDGLGYIIR
ncbi:hypothetical protein LS482_16130 [Sinomicrobium kalidii]|uniref:hypothetical protein n=1 Tax=Sinomicrobium kalidii TaxID=2900738 RepID=UPI001E52E127|nr:hypothetical protein [Sinomicrobium kalidii]UGU15201.1 hypothetical protein LS482_16130 [Sinomicrobium kalidii]